MSTEPTTFVGGPAEAAILVPTPGPADRENVSRNVVLPIASTTNASPRAIAATPSWSHITPTIGKPGWVVSLGILAVLSTLLVGLWLERRSADKRVESPAEVPELRSYLTGELGE